MDDLRRGFMILHSAFEDCMVVYESPSACLDEWQEMNEAWDGWFWFENGLKLEAES